jgi:hypothetical protein
LTITQDGAVIQNLEIRGKVTVNARNVVMRNVWVYTNNAWSIYVQPGKSLLIEDSEIGHPSHPGFRGIGGNNVTARRLDIHHVEDGIKLGSNTLYENVRVHDLDSPDSDPHSDAVQADGGQRNAVVRNSYLDATGRRGLGNAAVFIKSGQGPLDNITISGNYLNGGNYVIFVREHGSNGVPTNVTIRNNSIGSDYQFGLAVIDGPVTWYNNVWDGNGKTASPGGSDTRFTDVSSRYVFYNDIEWLADKGITQGCNSSGSRFCPDRAVTRGEMAAFLVRALGLPGAKRDWFRDDNGTPFEDAINRVADAGISKGCNPPANDRFCPDSKVSRGQMAAFLVRARGYSNNGGGNLFVDDNGLVYENDIDRLGTAGVTKGCNPPTNNRFCPNDSVTRGQMAAFLRRAFG